MLHCNAKCIAVLCHSPPKLHSHGNRSSQWTPLSSQIYNQCVLTKAQSMHCNARRRIRYDEDDEAEDDKHSYNEEIATLELYSQSARGEALLVRAMVDGQEEQVLVFKGFSSSLSYGTAPDPTKSVLPARAVIKSIDRIRGPFDPSNIEYIEQGLTWEAFRNRLPPKS